LSTAVHWTTYVSQFTIQSDSLTCPKKLSVANMSKNNKKNTKGQKAAELEVRSESSSAYQ